MTAITQPIDINPTYLETIQHILDEHVPNCEVRAFGSRAKWIARDYSDLDLVIVDDQPLGWRVLGQLETAFKESDLPFRVDVLDWHDISDNFRTLIEVDCIVIKNGSTQSTKWSEKPIGEVAKIVGGSTPSTKVPENFGGNIPWITPKDLSNSQNRYIYHGKRNLSQKGLEDCSAKLLPQGTVLLSTRAPIGYVAIAGTNITTNQGFRNLLFDKNIVDPEFAYYWLTSNTEELERHASGSTFKELSGSALKNIRMPIPPLSEQRDIAHILGTLDDKIELNRRMSETLEAMAQALFKSWFVDFAPVRAKIEGRWRPGESLPGLPAHLYDFFPDRLVPSDLGNIPEDWTVQDLGGICNKPQYGYTASADESPIGPKFLRITDINKSTWIDWNSVPYCKISNEKLSKYQLNKGDILIARIADPGHGCMFEENIVAVFASYLIRFCPIYKHHTRLLQYWLRSEMYWRTVTQRIAGTTRSNLNAKVLSQFPIVIPSSNIVSFFNIKIDNIRSQIVANVRESHVLADQHDILSSRLLSEGYRINVSTQRAEPTV